MSPGFIQHRFKMPSKIRAAALDSPCARRLHIRWNTRCASSLEKRRVFPRSYMKQFWHKKCLCWAHALSLPEEARVESADSVRTAGFGEQARHTELTSLLGFPTLKRDVSTSAALSKNRRGVVNTGKTKFRAQNNSLSPGTAKTRPKLDSIFDWQCIR